MQIYINKNGQQLGPFDEAKVAEMLQNGQLSANDLAIRQGEQQWQNLGALFPKTTPIASAQSDLVNQLQKKQGKGCRGMLGIGMILLGILIVVGGLANYGARQKNLTSFACDQYEKAFQESEIAFSKYQADKSYANEENWKAKNKSAQVWSESCGVANAARSYWRNVTIGLVIGGILLAIIGFLLRLF